ncbi:MAG: hypothetical protein AAF614_25095 [Chloroflexota bacterium]
MSFDLANILTFLNDVLQAIIVIFGSAVVLYNLNRALRFSVIRAFCALISFVVIVYLSELLVSRTIVTVSAETWLRLEWIGIALVPAAQYHLSDALLATTGAEARRRRYLVPIFYVMGLFFLLLALFSDLLVGALVSGSQLLHLQIGILFPVFAVYFWLTTAVSISNVWRARQRCITTTTRRRMSTTLIAFIAAPLAVFPYLLVSSFFSETIPLIFWVLLIFGNLVIGVMFAILTANLIYFGADSPDRVVRVRLFKFMARVPLAGTIVLLVFVLVSRSSRFLGLQTETALGFSLVATVMLVEWAIHFYKRPLERLFQLNDEPDVRRIQTLSERLLTTSDLHQFLESVLAATCEAMRTPTAFVAAVTDAGPKLEAVVGNLVEPESLLEQTQIEDLTANEHNGQTDLAKHESFIIWQNYWIRPLYDRKNELLVGILGMQARAETPNLTEEEHRILDRLVQQAAHALEDRIIQQQVFATVEGILPEITAFQEKRSAAAFGGLRVLTAEQQTTSQEKPVVASDDFNSMVRDALTHFWGGPKLTDSPLMRLKIVQEAMAEHDNNPTNALRSILIRAIEKQKPEGERSMTTGEWILYNILELKFIQGGKVRDVARRLAMSESDLYRKQRVAIENVARTIELMENAMGNEG